MAVTEIRQIPDPFELDDDESDEMTAEQYQLHALPELDVLAEAGMLGLHLGVIRRFAMLSLGAQARPSGTGLTR